MIICIINSTHTKNKYIYKKYIWKKKILWKNTLMNTTHPLTHNILVLTQYAICALYVFIQKGTKPIATRTILAISVLWRTGMIFGQIIIIHYRYTKICREWAKFCRKCGFLVNNLFSFYYEFFILLQQLEISQKKCENKSIFYSIHHHKFRLISPSP